MKELKLFGIIAFVSISAFVLETTVFSFPFIFFLGALMLFFYKKIYIYVTVFISAFIIDSLRVTNFGYTPIFLILTISIIMLYEKYSGSKDALVAVLIIGMAGFIYTHFMSYSIFLTILFYTLSIAGYALVNFLQNRKIIYI